MIDKKVPNKWASAVCVSHTAMHDMHGKTMFGLNTIADEVQEYCIQLACALSSGEVAIEVDDSDEDW